jgi:hypothetical protein
MTIVEAGPKGGLSSKTGSAPSMRAGRPFDRGRGARVPTAPAPAGLAAGPEMR